MANSCSCCARYHCYFGWDFRISDDHRQQLKKSRRFHRRSIHLLHCFVFYERQSQKNCLAYSFRWTTLPIRTCTLRSQNTGRLRYLQFHQFLGSVCPKQITANGRELLSFANAGTAFLTSESVLSVGSSFFMYRAKHRMVPHFGHSSNYLLHLIRPTVVLLRYLAMGRHQICQILLLGNESVWGGSGLCSCVSIRRSRRKRRSHQAVHSISHESGMPSNHVLGVRNNRG